jgi:hypothetical protein
MSLTLQQIFTKVSTHLLNQNEQSMGDMDCVLRTHDGLSCAIGCCIPDSAYEAYMETLDTGGKDMRAILQPVIGIHPDKADAKMRLLHSLMAVHDESSPAYWPEGLEEIRQNYNLK